MCVSVWVTPGTRLSVPGNHVRQFLVCPHAHQRHQVELAGHRVHLGDLGIWAMAAPVSGIRATSARISTIAVTTSASSGTEPISPVASAHGVAADLQPAAGRSLVLIRPPSPRRSAAHDSGARASLAGASQRGEHPGRGQPAGRQHVPVPQA